MRRRATNATCFTVSQKGVNWFVSLINWTSLARPRHGSPHCHLPDLCLSDLVGVIACADVLWLELLPPAAEPARGAQSQSLQISRVAAQL